jgi:hypothetical protein
MPKKASMKKVTVMISAIDCETQRAALPQELRARFGTMGFVKWTNCYLPVLITDPMQMVVDGLLPPGIYRAWMIKYSALDIEEGDNVSAVLDHIPVLAYWYGTTYELSILRLGDVLTWDEGVDRGLDSIPEFIQERIKANRPELSMYTLLQDALNHAKGQALQLPPEERSLALYTGNAKKKKPKMILNEWHALALDHPPHVAAWRKQQEKLQVEVAKLPSFRYYGEIAYLPRTCGSIEYNHPVLVLAPFRAPPHLRPEWFARCSSGDVVMVYWLGYFTRNSGAVPDSAYTFHKVEELKFLGRQHDEMPLSVMRQYEEGPFLKPQKLAKEVDLWVCGTKWELPLALERAAEDRWGGLEDFEEHYHDDFDSYWHRLSGNKAGTKPVESVDKAASSSSADVQETLDSKVSAQIESAETNAGDDFAEEIRSLVAALDDDGSGAATYETKRKSETAFHSPKSTKPTVSDEEDLKRRKLEEKGTPKKVIEDWESSDDV